MIYIYEDKVIITFLVYIFLFDGQWKGRSKVTDNS